jgi:hypothetical protein
MNWRIYFKRLCFTKKKFGYLEHEIFVLIWEAENTRILSSQHWQIIYVRHFYLYSIPVLKYRVLWTKYQHPVELPYA